MKAKKPLDAYHDQLVDDIKEFFGNSLKTVQAYFPDDQSEDQEKGLLIETPAALVEVEMLDEADDLGNGQDSVKCSVSIHCVLGFGTPYLQRELRNFALAMKLQVKNKPFGGVCKELSARPEQITAVPGVIEKGKYDSWVVGFEQIVFVGSAEWEGSDALPRKVFFGRAPYVGVDHLDKYEQVN